MSYVTDVLTKLPPPPTRDERARTALLAAIRRDLVVVKWMVGTNVALMFALFWKIL